MTEEINILALHCVGGRLNPEPSRAVHSWMYNKAAGHRVNFGKRKGAQVDRPSNQEIADTLLMEWYRWTRLWRPNLGAPRISPSCSSYVQDEKHNEESGDYEATHKREMAAVDFCVGSIAVLMQQAIGTEMRNREVKQKVWRDAGNATFAAALYAVLPHMRKHPDLMALFS